MITPINRRTFLRASGVAMALPLLESMHPALARAAAESPKRMVNVCTALGLYPSSWFPESARSQLRGDRVSPAARPPSRQVHAVLRFLARRADRSPAAQLRDHLHDGGSAPRARWFPEQHLRRPGGSEPLGVRDAVSVDRARDLHGSEPVVYGERRHDPFGDESFDSVHQDVSCGNPGGGQARDPEPQTMGAASWIASSPRRWRCVSG